jgi:cation transport ATPase
MQTQTVNINILQLTITTNMENQRLIGATVNGLGSIMVMRADKVGPDTLLAQIVKLVTDTQRTRAPI